MISLTLQAQDFQSLLAQVNKLAQQMNGGGDKITTPAAFTETETGETKESYDKKQPAEAEPAPPVTAEDTAAILRKLSAEKGLPAAKELLQKFKAKKIGELKPAQYREFMLRCQDALAQ